MHYIWDETRKAYHYWIAGEDIYVYSYDTLAEHLLEGYAGLVRVLPSDDDLSTEDAGSSDVPSRKNDPLANAHAPHSSH